MNQPAQNLGASTMTLYEPRTLGQDDLRLLKETLTTNLSDAEFALFVRACRHTGLDPFQKQIHAIKRGGKLSIQVAIDGFRLIADRTGRYAPGRATTYTYDGGGKLESATAYVMKMAGGQWHEVAETAYWDEYYPGDRQGHMWKKMPRVMLSKVAEARALRRAFPAELSGTYTGEEMAQAAPNETVEVHSYPEPVKLDTRRITDDMAQQLAIQVKQIAGVDGQERYDLATEALGRPEPITTFKGLEVWEARRVKQFAENRAIAEEVQP